MYPLRWQSQSAHTLWCFIVVWYQGIFHWHGLYLIPAWLSKCILKRDEITYLFLDFNGTTIAAWEWKGSSTLDLIGYVITFIMVLMKLADLIQSDHSNWVMWHVDEPFFRPWWVGCLTWEQCFHKTVNNGWYCRVFHYIFKIKLKKKKNNPTTWTWYNVIVFIDILEGYLPWNSCCYQMTDYVSLNSFLRCFKKTMNQ